MQQLLHCSCCIPLRRDGNIIYNANAGDGKQTEARSIDASPYRSLLLSSLFAFPSSPPSSFSLVRGHPSTLPPSVSFPSCFWPAPQSIHYIEHFIRHPEKRRSVGVPSAHPVLIDQLFSGIQLLRRHLLSRNHLPPSYVPLPPLSPLPPIRQSATAVSP